MARRQHHRRYTPEFREEALRLARSSPDSVLKVARDLGMNAATLRLWLKATTPASEPRVTETERGELRRLRRENRELRMERDILKKATAFFAKQSE
jgi:transposase